ncbi:MAG: HlyD family efflux transporter periplasmic adaptor subunit [Gemmatimonadota bacterium]|nr:HlyD family efflux transporter periplasmic adaptor subunit [Gemmatimonadota bacterium]
MAASDAPFMDSAPPHWVARGLSVLIITLFAVVLVAAVVVHVPEVVSGRFILVPVKGTDPVRALRAGLLSQVRVSEGDTVASGAALFVIRSVSLSDRSADLRTLETQRSSNEQRLIILKSQYETRRRSDAADSRRLENRIRFLDGLFRSKSTRLVLTRRLADSAISGAGRGAIGQLEASRMELEASTLAEEVQSVQNDLDETRSDIARLAEDEAARDLEYQEARRGLLESMETATIHIRSMGRDLINSTDSGLVVTTPCAGTVLRMHVNAPGAVVQEGEILSEMACARDRLQGELVLPQSGVPQVQPGQGVKLRFDAFPYQRYGVRFGTVRWLGPTGTTSSDSGAFRALIELRDDSIRVRGRMKPLLPGMGGSADIVTGRRSLVSFVFEPIRALKESFVEPPPAP